MRPFTVNGEVWRVAGVKPGDPRLIDRTGEEKLATTDPQTHMINLSTSLRPPLLDRVMLHEVAHAITMSYNLLDILHTVVPPNLWVFVEEWAVQLIENYGIEAVTITSESLGRPVCIGGFCSDQHRRN